MNRLSPITSKHLSEIRVATRMVIDLALDAWWGLDHIHTYMIGRMSECDTVV